MTIKSKDIFAKECLIQGLFLGVNPHYLMAVAMLRSGIKDDTDGDRIGPYRVTQQEWDANGGAADLEVVLDPPDINSWRLQCLYAALTAYRAQYGLPPCTAASGCFRKVNQSGVTAPLPVPDAGWAGEISLDLDMVSAICPTCPILLVEANTN